jgi:hypothetical protein
MGILSKVKSKAKTVAKGAVIGVAVGATAAISGPLLIAAKAAQRKVEKTEYKISSWEPLKSDPTLVSIKYSPALAFDKSDKLTVSGTPFDGSYSDPKYRTRNEVYIKPATPVTASGTGGTFKVKTSIKARAKGAASATKAGARTTAKKTGAAIKKGTGAVGNWVWNKFKWYIIGAIVFGALYLMRMIGFF